MFSTQRSFHLFSYATITTASDVFSYPSPETLTPRHGCRNSVPCSLIWDAVMVGWILSVNRDNLSLTKYSTLTEPRKY